MEVMTLHLDLAVISRGKGVFDKLVCRNIYYIWKLKFILFI